MRPTRPSWKPSGPSHRRSPPHRASDFLNHPNRHLIAFRRFLYGLGTCITLYCIHPLYSVGVPSLSDTLLSCIRTRRGGRPTYTLPIIINTTIGAQDNGWATIGISRSILPCHMARLTVLHYLPVSFPSHPLSRYLDRRTINNAHTKPNFPIVFRSRDLEM